MNTASNLLRRILIYIAGLFFLAFSVSISANSGLGISPVNSLPYVMALVSGFQLGNCVIAVYCLYVVIQILLLGKDFKWFSLFQIIFSILFGYFVDFTDWIIGDFMIPTYWGRLIMLGISMLFIAVGISLYVDVDLIPMPMEGLTLACAKKLNLPFHNMKIIADCTAVALSAGISIIFLNHLDGVREGTIITALGAGKLVAIVQKVIRPAVERYCS